VATQNIFDLTDTWNNVATTFTAIKMNVTDTTSASGSLLMDLQVGGASKFNVRKDGVVSAPNYEATSGSFLTPTFGNVGLNVRSTDGFVVIGDVTLRRDAANTLAQRNGANAQTFNLYNTYTDASNYERGEFAWGANILNIGATHAGTGTSRIVRFVGGGVTWLAINAASAASGGGIWNINTNGHFLAGTDNTYDIGASGATRPRNVYVGSNVIAAGFQFNAGGGLIGVSDGVMRLQDSTAATFNRLQFGGTTSSFPALKRNGAALDVRLADDSAYAALVGSQLTANTDVYVRLGSSIPAGGSTGQGINLSSTANFGVFFGSGAPTLSAAQGSLYLRSDGSSTSTRMYVNTNGSTTWTAVTTAA